nr:hypothetical membrane protein [uncultured archaeon]
MAKIRIRANKKGISTHWVFCNHRCYGNDIFEVVATLFAALLFVQTEHKLSQKERRWFHSFWDYLGFMTNSVLFFLIGIPLLFFCLNIRGHRIAFFIMPIAILIISRAIVVSV